MYGIKGVVLVNHCWVTSYSKLNGLKQPFIVSHNFVHRAWLADPSVACGISGDHWVVLSWHLGYSERSNLALLLVWCLGGSDYKAGLCCGCPPCLHMVFPAW